jgi:hypothetical protein
MSTVVSAAPIGVPVLRMRAEVLYRSLDSNTHRAVADLMELRLDHDRIAAILGLRLDQTSALIAEVDGSGGQRSRMIRVWVDSAHRAVLPGNGELHLLRADSRPGVPTLPLRRPTRRDLPPDAFASATPAHEAVVVDAVQGLHPDPQPGQRADSDELLLPDTHLLVTAGKNGPALHVQWHGVEDADLTSLANKKLLGPLALNNSLANADAVEQVRADLYARLGLTPTQAFPLPLDAGAVHDRVLDLIAQASKQIVLAIGDPIVRLEPWVSHALAGAAERQLDVYLLLPNTDETQGHLDPRIHVRAMEVPGGFIVVRDGERALAHSHALLLGAAWDFPDLAPQACLAVHDPEAARALCEQLGLDPPPRSESPARDTSRPVEEIVQDALRRALEQQSSHLPTGILAAVGEQDLRAFHEQAEREWRDLHHPGEVRSLAAGVAWERTVYTLLSHLASTAQELQLYQFRWKPPEGKIDLDIILRDNDREICWVIDAKHGPPRDGDINLMRTQLRLAREHNIVPKGWRARGMILHPISPEDRTTDGYADRINRDIQRTSIAQLPDLLLDDTLPQ